MQVPAAQLEYEAALAVLHERVADRQCEPDALARAMARCATAFERWSSGPAERESFPRERMAQHLALLEQLARRELADTARRLDLARAARRAVALHPAPERSPDSCDHSG